MVFEAPEEKLKMGLFTSYKAINSENAVHAHEHVYVHVHGKINLVIRFAPVNRVPPCQEGIGRVSKPPTG